MENKVSKKKLAVKQRTYLNSSTGDIVIILEKKKNIFSKRNMTDNFVS